MEDDLKAPLLVLMHGDQEVSTKNLARQIGAKTVTPCAPDLAQRHTGYMVGGTSPFGTRKPLPVYMERTIAELDRIYINGGRRGFLVSLAPADLQAILSRIKAYDPNAALVLEETTGEHIEHAVKTIKTIWESV
jgi:Cys-tRNA(Pro) deacylase